MYLELSYTDPGTGAVYPHACVVIANWRLQGDPPAAEVDLIYYIDANALAQQLPLRRRNAVPLTPPEINAWIQQFAQAGYATLAQRTEFTGARVVV